MHMENPLFSDQSNFMEALLVDPDVLRQKSSSVLAKINEMQRVFEALEASVNKTRGYWIGEAGDAHRTYFTIQKPEMEEVVKRLMEHVRELNEMAEGYSRTEREIKEISESLPSDVIV